MENLPRASPWMIFRNLCKKAFNYTGQARCKRRRYSTGRFLMLNLIMLMPIIYRG